MNFILNKKAHWKRQISKMRKSENGSKMEKWIKVDHIAYREKQARDAFASECCCAQSQSGRQTGSEQGRLDYSVVT